MTVLQNEFKKYRYLYAEDDVRYKINLYHDSTHILPNRFSFVFTKNGLLFKKYNKIFFRLPYENINKWTIKGYQFILVWDCTYLDDFYKKYKMFNYFKNHKTAILSVSCPDYPSLVIENTLKYFIDELMTRPEFTYLYC